MNDKEVLRLNCTIAVRYKLDEIPPDNEVKSELFRRSQQFTKMTHYIAENWGTMIKRVKKKHMVYAVKVDFIKYG